MVEIKERKRKYDYEKIVDAIQSIVETEDKRNPLPDRVIKILIEEQGIDCSQATVTHLRRNLLGIPARHNRRNGD